MCSVTVQMWAGWQDFKRFLVSALIKESSLFTESKHTNLIMLFAQGTFRNVGQKVEPLFPACAPQQAWPWRTEAIFNISPLTSLPLPPPSFLAPPLSFGLFFLLCLSFSNAVPPPHYNDTGGVEGYFIIHWSAQLIIVSLQKCQILKNV